MEQIERGIRCRSLDNKLDVKHEYMNEKRQGCLLVFWPEQLHSCKYQLLS